MEKTTNKTQYYLATLAAILFWSSSYIITKIAYTTFPPITLGAIRTIVAAAILFVIIKVGKKSEKIEKGDMKYLCLAGLFGVTLYFALQNVGIDYTSSSAAALISGAYPALIALMEFAVFRMIPSKKKAFGLGIAIIGVYMLSTTGGGETASNPILGNIFMLIAGISWGVYNFVIKNINEKYTPLTITYYQMVFGGIFFIPLALTEMKDWMMPTPASLASMLFLAIGCSIIAFLLYNFGLKGLTASSVTAMINVMPVIGLILGVTVLHDPIIAKQIIGGAIAIIGVVFSSENKE
ncbi:MAG: DMT family transporter [Eubacteriaceae bacterium]|nr:DMT family transporter [Eubacteriaceae bacterium]